MKGNFKEKWLPTECMKNQTSAIKLPHSDKNSRSNYRKQRQFILPMIELVIWLTNMFSFELPQQQNQIGEEMNKKEEQKLIKLSGITIMEITIDPTINIVSMCHPLFFSGKVV